MARWQICAGDSGRGGLFVEHVGDVFKQFSYRQMLRADFFTLSAFYAVRCLAVVLRMYAVIDHSVPSVVEFLRVHTREQIGYRNMSRATRRAISATRTGDQPLRMKNIRNASDGSLFRFVERSEIAHEREIVLHLFEIAHAGKHHKHAVKARRIAPSSGRLTRFPPFTGSIMTTGLPCLRQTS